MENLVNLAIVFGFSEKCYALCKQLIASWCKSVIPNNKFSIDFYPYKCNYKIVNKDLYIAFQDISIKPKQDWFVYDTFECNIEQDLGFCQHNIFPQSCVTEDFPHFYLPDLSVYQHFTDKFANKYEYVIYLHSDVIFKENNTILHDIDAILSSSTPYSIIAIPSINADFHISFRFVPYFNVINTSKFFHYS